MENDREFLLKFSCLLDESTRGSILNTFEDGLKKGIIIKDKSYELIMLKKDGSITVL